jgi:hypothetical protein
MRVCQSPSQELEAAPSEVNLNYDEVARKLFLLVERRDEETLKEAVNLIGQLIGSIE